MRSAAPPFATVGIVGVGLIGGSIAKALRRQRRWPAVLGVDNEAVVLAARKARLLDEGSPDVRSLADVDLVVLAAPVRTNIGLLKQLAAVLPPDAVVTDVSSTKRAVVAAADRIPKLTFIGGHPMSGASRGGLQHARADLFEGRPWILTPRPKHSAAVSRLEAFIDQLGAVAHVMTPELHDRFVGAVSHLPQVTASALMHVVGKLAGDAGLELAGSGLHDTTRLASSPADIWRDIAATNEDVIGDALDMLIRTLTEMRASLSGGEAIEAVFGSACRWREVLQRARGDKE